MTIVGSFSALAHMAAVEHGFSSPMSLSFPTLTLAPDDLPSASPPAPQSATVLRPRAVPAAGTVGLREAVLANHAFVWRSVRRLGVPETDVEDATQRVFMVLAKNFEQVEPTKLRSYLFGVAVRVSANERRAARARRATSNDAEAERVACPSAPADEALDRRRARAMLDEILDALDDDLRTVFVLHELEHLTMAEIAELIGIPSGTAASRLRRARAEVAEHAARLRARLHHPGGSR